MSKNKQNQAQLAQLLVELDKQIAELEHNISAHPDNPFACQWTRTGASLSCHMGEKRSVQWRAYKRKAALKFLSLVKAERAQTAKKLRSALR